MTGEQPVAPGQVWAAPNGRRRTEVLRPLPTAPTYPQRWVVKANVERVMREDVLRREYRRIA